MSTLKHRIGKLEMASGVNGLSYADFLRDLLALIDGTSRGLPSEQDERGGGYEQACEQLYARYRGNERVEAGCLRLLEQIGGTCHAL